LSHAVNVKLPELGATLFEYGPFWATPAYAYWVVSDLGLPELRDFTGLLRQADSTAASAK
jgi:hypothetical protein